MSIVDVRPFINRKAIITLGTDDFAKAISDGHIEPSAGTTDYKGLKPDAVFTFPQATTYVLVLSFSQDWSSEDSLSRYLWDHRGETVPFTLNPDDTSGMTPGVGSTEWSGNVAIAPGAVGGKVDEVAVSDVTLGIVGEPVATYVPPVVATSSVDEDVTVDVVA